MTEKLLSAPQVAEKLGVGVRTLTVWRCTGRHGLPYIKLSGNRVRYRESVIDQWLKDRERSGFKDS